MDHIHESFAFKQHGEEQVWSYAGQAGIIRTDRIAMSIGLKDRGSADQRSKTGRVEGHSMHMAKLGTFRRDRENPVAA